MSTQISSLRDCDGFGSEVPWVALDLEYAILEAPWEVRFLRTKLHEQPVFRPEDYPCGQMFGAAAELRWRRMRGGRFRAVLIDDGGAVLSRAQGEALPELAEMEYSLPEEYLLWKPHGEPRIPHPIEYPGFPPQAELAVKLKHYELPPDGGILTRCRGLRIL